MAIPKDIIDRIRQLSDIVEVVGQVVSLSRSGSHYAGLCPFHKERTPSFKVFPESQNFHCFGCGEGGSVFDFLMKTEGLSFPEAVRVLADRAGVEVPDARRDPDRDRETAEIGETLELAARFYVAQLGSGPGRAAREYLAGRGLAASAIERFRIGYAPDAWDGLLTALTRHRDGAALERAGLAIRRRSGDGHYDRFRDRLVFPIVSPSGRVIGFGGRALGDTEPKYLNSPETRVYHKSRVLYGLREARHAIRRERHVLVVEGYMDVIALNQAGVENAVATCGTSLTAEHASMLARYAPEVVILFDGDAAGVRAALKAFETVLPTGVLVRTVTLPEGADPDDLVRGGDTAALMELVAARQDVVDFFYTRSKGDPKPAAIDRLARLVARVPEEIPRRELSARAADWFKFDEETFVRAVDTLRRGKPHARPSESIGRTQTGGIHGLEGELLRVAVQDPAFWVEVRTLAERESLRLVLERRIRPSVRVLLDELADQSEPRPASAFRDEVSDPVLRNYLMELATEGVVDREHLHRTQRDLVSRLFYLALKDERDRLRRELNQAQQSGDREREREISQRYRETILRLSAIEANERAETP